MSTRKPRKIKAWLVTWEGTGDHAKRGDKVAAILDPRLSPHRVRELVEVFYSNICYSLSERVAYIAKKNNPYRAKFMDIDGDPWTGGIHCGDNPWLQACRVIDLAIERDEHGKEIPHWKKRDKPNRRRLGRLRQTLGLARR